MEIQILEKQQNELLNRLEVRFKVTHPKEKTPKRSEVKDMLASALKVKKETTIIEYLKPSFGLPETPGYAKVYNSKEDAQRTEPEHILKRNNLFEAKKTGEKKEEA